MNGRRDTGPWVLPLLVILALAGAAISLMLTSYHMSRGDQEPGRLFQLACGADGGGCSEVLASPWAVLPGGIPIAALGLVYFGSLALWYLVVGRANRRGRFWQALPFGLNALGALVSVFLVGVMMAQLHEICRWCLLSHLLNFAILSLAWKLWPQEEGYSGDPPRPSGRLGLAGLLLIAAFAVLCFQRLVLERMRLSTEEANDYARTFYEDADLQRYLHLRKTAVEIPIRPHDAIRGNPSAPHTVVVFSDFECPACRGFAQLFESRILPQARGRVKLVYKHFPLEPDCNPGLEPVHPNACEAAEAAEAARAMGGGAAFWKMHDAMFREQPALAQAPWASLANRNGLDGARIADQVARNTHRSRILEDAALGRRLGIQQTPAVYLDGRPFEDLGRLDVWMAILGN